MCRETGGSLKLRQVGVEQIFSLLPNRKRSTVRHLGYCRSTSIGLYSWEATNLISACNAPSFFLSVCTAIFALHADRNVCGTVTRSFRRFDLWPFTSTEMVYVGSARKGTNPYIQNMYWLSPRTDCTVFACRYDTSAPQNVYSHLTNASINKHGASFDADKDVIGKGSKWTLNRFFAYLTAENKVDCRVLWERY